LKGMNLRAISPAMTGAAIMLVGLLVGGGAFYAEQAFAADPATLEVQTDGHVNNLDSVHIQVQIQHGAPSSSYSVTIKVATPTIGALTPAGGPFCDTVAIATDGGGDGQATVNYPTGVPAALFTAKQCVTAGIVVKAGTGGPSTELPGTYTVTASSTPAITAGTPTTTFAVKAAEHVVTGSGTYSAVSTVTYTGIAVPAPLGSPPGPYYLTCSGPVAGTPPVTTTAPTTYPSAATRYGSVTFTGVISTNTPGQSESISDGNPCVTPAIATTHVEYVLNDVTICLGTVTSGGCVGATVTGGLVTTTYAAASTTTAGTPPITTAVNWDLLTLTGTGSLEGLSGTGVATAIVVTAGGVTTLSTTYDVKLSNVPGAGAGAGDD